MYFWIVQPTKTKVSKEAEDEGGVRITMAPYRNVRNEEKENRLSVADMSNEREGILQREFRWRRR